MSHTPETVELGRLESTHLDAIDPGRRRGKPRHLFMLGFSGALSIGDAVFGALASILGNSSGKTVIAVPVGNPSWVSGGAR